MLFYLWDKLLDFIFPKNEIVLELERMAKNGELVNLPNATQSPFRFVNPVFNYKNRLVRTLVWSIKYKENKDLTKAIGKIMFENILEDLGESVLFEGKSKPLLIPIPTTTKNAHKKGFNQTETICTAIKDSDESNFLEYRKDLLKKIRETARQTTLRRSQRLNNLEGSFAVKDRSLISGRKIILIDDVTTTGATLGEVRKTLLRAGAKNVLAYTIAH